MGPHGGKGCRRGAGADGAPLRHAPPISKSCNANQPSKAAFCGCGIHSFASLPSNIASNRLSNLRFEILPEPSKQHIESSPNVSEIFRRLAGVGDIPIRMTPTGGFPAVTRLLFGLQLIENGNAFRIEIDAFNSAAI